MIHALPLLLFVAAQAATDLSTTVYRVDDGSRVLRQEVIVDASVEEVWKAFTTKAGWESWAVPFAHIDLRVGGLIETSYEASAERGEEGNIHSRILSFLPYRMLSVQATQAPPGFAHADLLGSLHSVFQFDPVDDERTRVTISGVGYREGAGYDALLESFRQGNAWTLDRLKKRFEQGPLDWATPATSPDSAHQQ